MAEVTLSVGGYQYQVACRDGEEDHLLRLGDLVDTRVKLARQAVGNASEVRQLLLSALLFADEALEAKPAAAAPAPSPSAPEMSPEITTALETLADRVEMIAARLEKIAQPS